MRKILFAGAALVVAFGSQAASAATIISCGGASSCITDTDNVLLDSATGVMVGTGETNTTPAASVEFTSTTDLLNLDASGQATISAVDEVLNSLTFTLLGGAIFERAEFNLFNGAANPLSVTIMTNTGSSETFDIANANGANRFGVTAGAGEALSSVTFTSAVGFDSLRQLRIGGVSTPGAIPEPGTWLMLLVGFGLLGGVMRSAKRKQEVRVRYV